jgi:hypothetical protein
MTTSNQLRTAILISVCLVGGTCVESQPNYSSEQKSLVAAGKLTQLMPSDVRLVWDATLTFMSDDTLGLQVCQSQSISNCPLLIVLQIFDGGLLTIAQRETSSGRVSLFRTEDGGMLAISEGERSSQLFSNDLTLKYQFPYSPSHVSLSSKIAAAYVPKDMYTIFRMCPQLDCIEEVRRVSGELEAVSDDSVVIRDHDTIRVETLQGTPVSTFKVKSRAKCAIELQIVGQGKLFLQSCGPDRIIDLHGKELTRFRPSGGWGSRRGWSADGTRLLYDRYIRAVPLLQRVGEDSIAIATLGAGTVEERTTGEAVRVVDTTAGGICFEWKDPKGFMNEGVYHADISPSGRLVALVTRGDLFVYRLPTTCAAK